jgi:xanthine dehydrogenase accessory factor
MPSLPLTTDTHQTIATSIDSGRPFALAVVLKTTGSVPREAGTKAIIAADGAIHGTIGGGLLESEAQRLALDAMRTKRPALFDFKFTGPSASVNEPICGGTMRVLIDPIEAKNQRAFAEAADAVRRRRRGILITTIEFPPESIATLGATAGSFSSAADRAAAVGWAVPTNSSGATAGLSSSAVVEWLPADAVRNENGPRAEAVTQALAKAATQSFEHPSSRPGYKLCGIAEPVIPSARLLIAGGGHVGQALAAQAQLVGFEVIVVEDRAEYAAAGRYPDGVVARHGEFADVLAEFPIDELTYVAIVGRGHPVDIKALVACIDSPAAYIGMMGSRRKVALARKELIDSGKVIATQFARVYAPIGLNLGAETVPEIAASIVAQLVAVRRTGSAPRFE